MIATCGPFALTLIACLAAPPASREERHEWYIERYEWITEQYGSADPWPADRRLRKEWEGTVNALTTVVSTTDSELARECAIERLTDMRAEAAVWTLIQHVTLRGPGVLSLQEPLWRYPAALALVKIGQPAVWQILVNRLRVPASDEELSLFAAVVHGHYSFDSAVGRFHVERVIADVQKQIDGEKKPQGSPSRPATWRQNLTRLLEFYDALDRGELIPGSTERKQRTEAGGPSRPTDKRPESSVHEPGSLQ